MSRELISRNAGLIEDPEVVGMLLPDAIRDGLTMLRELTEGAVWDRDMFDTDGKVCENLAKREVVSGRVAGQHVRDLAEKGIKALDDSDTQHATFYYIHASKMFISRIRNLEKLKEVPPPPNRPRLNSEQCLRLYEAAEKFRRKAEPKRIGMANACRKAILGNATLLPGRQLDGVGDKTLERMFQKGRSFANDPHPHSD